MFSIKRVNHADKFDYRDFGPGTRASDKNYYMSEGRIFFLAVCRKSVLKKYL